MRKLLNAQTSEYYMTYKELNVHKVWYLHYFKQAVLAHDYFHRDKLPKSVLKNYIDSVIQQPEGPVAPIETLNS